MSEMLLSTARAVVFVCRAASVDALLAPGGVQRITDWRLHPLGTQGHNSIPKIRSWLEETVTYPWHSIVVCSQDLASMTTASMVHMEEHNVELWRTGVLLPSDELLQLHGERLVDLLAANQELVVGAGDRAMKTIDHHGQMAAHMSTGVGRGYDPEGTGPTFEVYGHRFVLHAAARAVALNWNFAPVTVTRLVETNVRRDGGGIVLFRKEKSFTVHNIRTQ